jgi:hypothetical protein
MTANQPQGGSVNEERLYSEEYVLRAVEEMGTALTALFDREANIIRDEQRAGGPTGIDPRRAGMRDAYEACAEAVTKATTRKMIVWPEVAIKFTVPAEAKP